jgi:tRNA threonylcarbamoyladenosine biosynthesis protein TsaE
MVLVFTLNNIHDAARQCWQAIAPATILAFHGEMGAGKTTFIHALCDVKGVKDVVSSPTFSIVNEYYYIENAKEKKIFHIDLYRLRDQQEALDAGIEDCLFSDHSCLIEWPEKIEALLPADTCHMQLEVVDDQTRRLIIKGK